MKRSQLEHVLRAEAAIAQETTVVVVDSQAILMAFPHAPDELLVSREIDVCPVLHPEKSDLIEGAIGAVSSFEQTFGYYADGVGPETAVMSNNWRTRGKLYYIGEVTVICPEVHDLAVSKCVAGRDKGADFIRALFRHSMIELPVMMEPIGLLESTKHLVQHITQSTQRRAQEATE